MDSVFNNNNNSVYGSYGNGMTYGVPNKELTWTNPITAEEERSLQRGTAGISLDIPKESMIRAKCTHRDPQTRKFTLRENEDGSVTCLKCGARFNLVNNVPLSEISKIVGGVIDILQTTKLSYVDMTPDVIQSYFIILPFLEILPKMYETSMHTIDKVMKNMGLSGNYATNNAFENLYSTLGMGAFNPMMMAAMMQQMANANANANAGGAFMNPPGGEVPSWANPFQTGAATYGMPGVVDSTAKDAAAPPPAAGQSVQVGKKFKLD